MGSCLCRIQRGSGRGGRGGRSRGCLGLDGVVLDAICLSVSQVNVAYSEKRLDWSKPQMHPVYRNYTRCDFISRPDSDDEFCE